MSLNSGIYKITHRDSGRIYIGQSIKLKRRLNGYKNAGGSGNGNSVIKRAILKYGWDAFDWEILLYANNMDYLNEMEIKLISAYDCLAPKGFNIKTGGSNAPFPEHLKKLFSEQRKGKKHTEEARKKMSIGQKKRWENPTQEMLDRVKEQAKNINLGKTFSENHRKNISETRKRLIAEGKLINNTFAGKNHSEETKKKMSESHTGRKLSPESIQNCKEASLKRWQNPEYRAKVKEAKMKKSKVL